MSETSPRKEEYEVLAYSKLNHVKASIVQIINRNTHVHRALELGLALEGSGQVRVGGRSFPIARGSLFFFNANEPHEIYASSQAGIRIAYLQVATSFCYEYVSSFRNLELLQNDLTAFLPREQHQELVLLMIRALMDYMSPLSDLHGLRCICSICQLYSKLLEYVPYRQMEESAYLSKNKKMARLNRVTEYIDENYAEKITLEELARKEQVSVTYLSHFIRENLNMTFQEYISSVRFERALKLLRSSSMCLTDVSVVCGFSDVKYLTRMLESHFGMNAVACREKLRREAPVLLTSEEEKQTFASEEIARNWLADFEKSYIN
jgi:AraC-like DNA-binding protein/mannose-6-phosphate isomerase-like protein (cupin superfamily)